MPVFYFHLQYTARLLRDDEGSEFPTLSAAKEEARTTARNMLIEAIKFEHKSVPDALLVSDWAPQSSWCLLLVVVSTGRRNTLS